MKKINVLIVSGKLTIEHNYRVTNDLIRTLLEATGRFSVKVTEEFRGATKETVSGYDLIIYNYDGKDMPVDSYQRIGEQAEDTLFSFIHDGGGFVIHHSSTILDPGLPEEYYKVWGYYVPMESCRRAPVDDWIATIHPGDPITDGLNQTLMCPCDDIFGGIKKYPGTNPEILVTVFDDVKYYDVPGWPPAHHPVHIPDGDLNKLPGINTDIPLAWKNYYGKGRVFGCSIGHGIDTFRRFDYDGLFVRGCEWAATGHVTLNKPDRSGDNRLKPWPYY